MPDLHGWTMTPWNCVCGRTHAPWWRSTPPPSCPHGWPSQPEHALTPPTLQSIVEALDAVAAQGPLTTWQQPV